jgi:glycerol-3-phosphate dehydrogenase
MALSIEDILARRLGLEAYGWKEAVQAALVVADLLAREFGWASEKKQTAIDEYICRIRSLMEKAGISPTLVT